MNRKKKILEVTYVFDYGGIRAFVMNYLSHIDNELFDIDIYSFGCEDSPFKQQVQDMGFQIYFEPENISPFHIPRFVSKLEKFMNDHGPYDVVHANNNLISAWVLLAAKRAGVPVRISHSHNTSHFNGSIIQRIYSWVRLKMIERLATVKMACGEKAGEAMYGKNSDFVVANNGIDVNRFLYKDERRIEEIRASLNIPIGSKVYANITRMDSQKNHLFAIEVFNEIHKIDTTAVFVYGGITPAIKPTVEAVSSRITELGLDEFVRYTGPFMDIEQVYHMTDLWIYCSVYEGLPFGPIELQAASVPCIVSDVVTKEIDLELGLVHFLSLKDSPRKWAELAVSIDKTEIPKERIIDAFAKHNYDICHNVKQIERIYLGE